MKKFLTLSFLLAVTLISQAQTITNNPITLQNYITSGTNIYPSPVGTNFYIDFNIPSTRGYYIYQSVIATNDVFFTRITNAVQWREVSINVLASGGTRRIGFTTNLPHANTNGLTIINGCYSFYLTNGNEFRISVQTNGATLSTIWSTFGQ